MTFGQVSLPQLGVASQALIIAVEPSQEFLPLQGIDGCMHDIDDSSLTSLG